GGWGEVSNGKEVSVSRDGNGEGGAATWGDGGTEISGTVSAANSLVGGNAGDLVGYEGVTVLSNGNYVVDSRFWNGGRGAVTWGSGTAGVSGIVSDANSLVGSTPGNFASSPPGDYVGFTYNYHPVTALSNGSYVVASPFWNAGRGAVTWGNGDTGVTGVVSEANSLVGGNPGDLVGGFGGYGNVTALS